jgi:tetratricopeptide (TPR) repeat protein
VIPAETAYLFRHALARDAAYQLQLPADRSRLHGLALALIESRCGRPESWDVDPFGIRREPHPSDEFAFELAAHARACGLDAGGAIETLYVWRAATLARSRSDLKSATEQFDRVAADARLDVRRRIAAQVWAAHSALTALPKPEAERRAAAAVRAALETGDAACIAESLRVTAIIQAQRGEFAKARATLDGVAPYLEGASERLVADTGLLEASLEFYLGRPASSERRYRELLPVVRRLPGGWHAQRCVGSLGIACREMDLLEEAESLLREAIDLAESIGARGDVVTWLNQLAVVLDRRGRRAEAQEAVERALARARELGDRKAVCACINTRALTLKSAGRIDQAERLWREALEVAVEIDDAANAAVATSNIAFARETVGDFAAAEAAYRDARSRWARAGAAGELARSHFLLGTLFARAGRLEDSLQELDLALERFRSLGGHRSLSRALFNRTVVLLDLGRFQDAACSWTEALSQGVTSLGVWPSIRDELNAQLKRLGLPPLREDHTLPESCSRRGAAWGGGTR